MEIFKYLDHSSFFRPNITQLNLKMWTDASSTGYGATTDDQRITQGSQSEKNLHSNVLELVTLSIVVKDLKLSKICILLETDNVTIRFAINK